MLAKGEIIPSLCRLPADDRRTGIVRGAIIIDPIFAGWGPRIR